MKNFVLWTFYHVDVLSIFCYFALDKQLCPNQLSSQPHYQPLHYKCIKSYTMYDDLSAHNFDIHLRLFYLQLLCNFVFKVTVISFGQPFSSETNSLLEACVVGWRVAAFLAICVDSQLKACVILA